jgi:hypothetical protein
MAEDRTPRETSAGGEGFGGDHFAPGLIQTGDAANPGAGRSGSRGDRPGIRKTMRGPWSRENGEPLAAVGGGDSTGASAGRLTGVAVVDRDRAATSGPQVSGRSYEGPARPPSTSRPGQRPSGLVASCRVGRRRVEATIYGWCRRGTGPALTQQRCVHLQLGRMVSRFELSKVRSCAIELHAAYGGIYCMFADGREHVDRNRRLELRKARSSRDGHQRVWPDLQRLVRVSESIQRKPRAASR